MEPYNPNVATAQPTPAFQSAPAPQGNGLAVAGLVLGIIAVAFFWMWPIAIICGILGIVFGAIGVSKAKRLGGTKRGMALAGLILGILGLVGSIVFIFVIISAVEHDLGDMRDLRRQTEKRMQQRMDEAREELKKDLNEERKALEKPSPE